mmetsp:Transcript_129303/g.374428  ORF Transcript_129303/g.374428 Transcript_129303/m.374428 type:complete len:215 (+) Transcript_129303:102-746(+)
MSTQRDLLLEAELRRWMSAGLRRPLQLALACGATGHEMVMRIRLWHRDEQLAAEHGQKCDDAGGTSRTPNDGRGNGAKTSYRSEGWRPNACRSVDAGNGCLPPTWCCCALGGGTLAASPTLRGVRNARIAGHRIRRANNLLTRLAVALGGGRGSCGVGLAAARCGDSASRRRACGLAVRRLLRPRGWRLCDRRGPGFVIVGPQPLLCPGTTGCC